MFCLFYILVFGHEACGILVPSPGIEPAPPALEGEALTTGPPAKSQVAVALASIDLLSQLYRSYKFLLKAHLDQW